MQSLAYLPSAVAGGRCRGDKADGLASRGDHELRLATRALTTNKQECVIKGGGKTGERATLIGFRGYKTPHTPTNPRSDLLLMPHAHSLCFDPFFLPLRVSLANITLAHTVHSTFERVKHERSQVTSSLVRWIGGTLQA